MGYNIISPQGEQVIKNFKYKGGSVSYSYDAIWSPLAQTLLDYVPRWWAPNAITLAGLVINLLGSAVICLQGYLGDSITPWKFLFYALCVFTYQTLDNIDGKQARKTGNSSPLGMLFDHGCDAFGLLFLTLSVGRIVRIENQQIMLLIGLIGVWFGFYFSVWCQYYSGGIMILGKINAVDDGIPVVWMLSIFTYLIGHEFWRVPLLQIGNKEYKGGEILAYAVCCSCVLQIGSSLLHSMKNFTKDWMSAVFNLSHYFVTVATLLIIINFSRIHIHHFYCVFFGMGIMFVRNIVYMQVCVTTEMPYRQFQPGNILFCVGYPLFIFVLQPHFLLYGFGETVFAYSILLLIVIDFFFFAIKTMLEFRRILNIRVFRVSKQIKRQ